MANEIDKNNGEIIIYQTADGQTQIDVRMENETVWLTQKQIAELFGTKRPAITKHLKNIYASEELDENSTCSILEHMGNDGKQTYSTNPNKMAFTRLVEVTFLVIMHFFRKLFVSLWSNIGNTV